MFFAPVGAATLGFGVAAIIGACAPLLLLGVRNLEDVPGAVHPTNAGGSARSPPWEAHIGHFGG